jgi:hypothetical protein
MDKHFQRPSFLAFRLCEPLRLPGNFIAGTAHEQSDGTICAFADLCVFARNNLLAPQVSRQDATISKDAKKTGDACDCNRSRYRNHPGFC